MTAGRQAQSRGGCTIPADPIDWKESPEYAPVAQLDRASGYEPEGRVFESPRAHHKNKRFALQEAIAETALVATVVAMPPEPKISAVFVATVRCASLLDRGFQRAAWVRLHDPDGEAGRGGQDAAGGWGPAKLAKR